MENPEGIAVSKISKGDIIGSSSAALEGVNPPSEQAIVEASKTPDITPIAELRPTSYNKVIEVRVYRKWISVTHGKKNESGFSPKKKENAFCCILIDREV